MPSTSSAASTAYTQRPDDSSVHSTGCPQSSGYKKIKGQAINGSQDLDKLVSKPCYTCDPKAWTALHSQRATAIEAQIPPVSEPPTPTSFVNDQRTKPTIKRDEEVTTRNDSDGEEEVTQSRFCGLSTVTVKQGRSER